MAFTMTMRQYGADLPAVGQPRATKRPETVRLYTAEWLAFVTWCRLMKRVALPAGAETLAAYLLDAAPGASRGSIGRKRAAIRAIHRQHDLPPPGLDPQARAAVRQAAATRPRDSRPASLATSPRALWMSLALKCPRDTAGLRDRALLLLAAAEKATREELLGLEREQVRFTEAGAELHLWPGERESVVIARETSDVCPVRALEEWLEASHTSFGPVFRKVDRWGNVEHARLGPDGLRRIVARRTALRGRRGSAG